MMLLECQHVRHLLVSDGLVKRTCCLVPTVPLVFCDNRMAVIMGSIKRKEFKFAFSYA